MTMWVKVLTRLQLQCNGTRSGRSILLSLPAALTRNVHNTAITFAPASSGTPKIVPEGSSPQESPNSNIQQLVHHLERTSLVDFESAEAVNRLTEAINFADQLFEVNTEGVEPLVTVLENESLYLRDDTPEPTRRQDILKNASVTEEDYFVAPPGNIPLEPASKNFLKDDDQNQR